MAVLWGLVPLSVDSVWPRIWVGIRGLDFDRPVHAPNLLLQTGATAPPQPDQPSITPLRNGAKATKRRRGQSRETYLSKGAGKVLQ